MPILYAVYSSITLYYFKILKIYLYSYLINFTAHLKLAPSAAKKAQGVQEESPTMELEVLLAGIGLSLVDNINRREVLYLRLQR